MCCVLHIRSIPTPKSITPVGPTSANALRMDTSHIPATMTERHIVRCNRHETYLSQPQTYMPPLAYVCCLKRTLAMSYIYMKHIPMCKKPRAAVFGPRLFRDYLIFLSARSLRSSAVRALCIQSIPIGLIKIFQWTRRTRRASAQPYTDYIFTV